MNGQVVVGNNSVFVTYVDMDLTAMLQTSVSAKVCNAVNDGERPEPTEGGGKPRAAADREPSVHG